MEFDGSNFDFTPNIDFSSVEEISNAIEETNREKREIEKRKLEAAEATARNTAEATNRLNIIIDNQNEYIKSLKQQLETQEQQLAILKSIFAADTNAVEVEKELIEIIRKTVDDKHPIWDYVKDKGSDLAIPLLYSAVKIWLASKGINLP